MKAVIKPWLYTIKGAKGNGKFPVKLKVTFRRENNFFSLGIDMDESEFNSYHINKKLKDIFADITYYLKKAEKITDELKEAFSFKTFKEHFMVHQKFNLKRKLMTIFGHLALPTLIN